MTRCFSAILAIFVLHKFVSCKDLSEADSHKARLFHYLLSNHSVDYKVDTEKSTVTVHAALYSILNVSWYDPNFVWDPADFGGVTEIRIHSARLFTPDLMIYEMKSHERVAGKFAVVHRNGTIATVSADIVDSYCKINIDQFPNDEQSCSITFVSTVFPNTEMTLKPLQRTADAQFYVENTEWELISFTVDVDCNEFYGLWYDEVKYTVTIRRRPFYYFVTLALPTFMLISLTLVGLFSPSNAANERAEKVSIGLTALLTMAIILMIVGDLMPKTPNTPKLGKYIMYQMGVICVGTILSVAIMYLHQLAAFGVQLPELVSRLMQCRVRKSIDYDDPFNFVSREKARVDYKIKKSLESTSHFLLGDHESPTIQFMTAALLTLNKRLKSIEKRVHHQLNVWDNDRFVKEDWMRLCAVLDLICLMIAIMINLWLTFWLYWY